MPIGRGPGFQPRPGVDVRAAAQRGYGCATDRGQRDGVHLELFAAGRVVVVPAGIGAAPPLQRDRARVTGARCFYPLLTLEPTGLIEILRGTHATLGDLAALWGVPLSATRLLSFRGRVRAYLDGRRVTGDLRAIVLHRHAQVVLAIGPRVPIHAKYSFPPGL